jgi:hypothetical protein
MPETIEKTIFAYSELSESAKQKARAWWLEGYEGDADWIMGEVKEAAEMLGISLEERGKYTAVYWQAGHCQSDGASFSGSYGYRKGALSDIRAQYPKDETLQQIAKDLQEAQRRAFWALTASITSRRNTSISVDVSDGRTRYGDTTPELEAAVSEAMRDFSQWIYRLAITTHDFQTSDENIAESMAANEYRFDEHGRIE